MSTFPPTCMRIPTPSGIARSQRTGVARDSISKPVAHPLSHPRPSHPWFSWPHGGLASDFFSLTP
jgi:hypothetical protein